MTRQIQAQICTAVLEGSPAPGLIEEELLQQISQFVSAQRGNDTQTAALHSVLCWNSAAGSWSLKGKFPAITVDPQSHARATADSHPLLQVEPDEVAEDAPGVVSGAYMSVRHAQFGKGDVWSGGQFKWSQPIVPTLFASFASPS